MDAQSFVDERLDVMAQAGVDVCKRITGMPLPLPVINQLRARVAKIQFETSKINFQLLKLAYLQLPPLGGPKHALGESIEGIMYEFASPIRRQAYLDLMLEEAMGQLDALQEGFSRLNKE